MANNGTNSWGRIEVELFRRLTGSSETPYRILNIVKRHDGVTYDTLEEETGLSRSAVRYHIRLFAEIGVVTRESNPVIVDFTDSQAREAAVGILERIASNPHVGNW